MDTKYKNQSSTMHFFKFIGQNMDSQQNVPIF